MIELSELVYAKVLSPNVVTPVGMLIEIRLVQPVKANFPMYVTPDGIKILENFAPPNA